MNDVFRYNVSLQGLGDNLDEFRARFARNLNVICDRMGFPKSGHGRATKLADIFQISPPAAHKWLTAGSLPSLDKLPDICAKLNCTTDDLLIGLGAVPNGTGRYARVSIDDEETSNLCDVLLHENCVSALGGKGPYRIMRVATNDMEPFVMPGDYVIFDLGTKSFSTNGVYVFCYDGRKLIRRIQLGVDGQVTMRCDNPRFAPEVLSDFQYCDGCGTRIPGKNCVGALGLVTARLLIRR